MIKVMLKKPVTSGYDQDKNLVDKMGNFLLVQGEIDDQFVQRISGEGLEVKWWRGKNNVGKSVLIPIENIAYLEEV
jgi:hypothetical protein